MYLGIFNCYDTEKGFFFQNLEPENLFVTGVLCSQINPLAASRYRNW